MGLILFQAGRAGDFELQGFFSGWERLEKNLRDLLRVRDRVRALELLSLLPFELLEATNHFNDEFHVLHASVPVDLYEEARRISESRTDRQEFAHIAETITEIGPYLRFIAVDLDLSRNPGVQPSGKGLTTPEINKLVYKYIGVEGGYLGDFSYQRHHDFYVELELDINPYNYVGTTRSRFIQILSKASPDVQARILGGILDRYPVNSTAPRTPARHDEIKGWIRRLTATGGVPAPSLRITSSVVERAMADAEKLISASGATSGVDRVHTALHGYLNQVCADSQINADQDATLTQLFKLLRKQHAAFSNLGHRGEDIGRILNSLASVLDVLNPIRNKASVAHPNQNLLPDAEAMLVINTVRTILHYFDSKLPKP